MKYFSAVLCQNIVPQNKMKFSKTCSHRNLHGMFRIIHSVSLTTDPSLANQNSAVPHPRTGKLNKSTQADKKP